MKNLSDDALRAQGWEQQTDGGNYMDHVGPLWYRGEGEHREYGMRIEDKHLNVNGVAHGGILMSLMDQVVGNVVWDLGDHTPMATIDMSTHFITVAKPGEWVTAKATLQRRTRSLVFASGRLSVDDNTVLSAQAIMKLRV